MNKLTLAFGILCLSMAIVFAFGAKNYFALKSELEQTQQNLVDTSNMLLNANKEIDYWQEIAPLLKSGELESLKEKIKENNQELRA